MDQNGFHEVDASFGDVFLAFDVDAFVVCDAVAHLLAVVDVVGVLGSRSLKEFVAQHADRPSVDLLRVLLILYHLGRQLVVSAAEGLSFLQIIAAHCDVGVFQAPAEVVEFDDEIVEQ